MRAGGPQHEVVPHLVVHGQEAVDRSDHGPVHPGLVHRLQQGRFGQVELPVHA